MLKINANILGKQSEGFNQDVKNQNNFSKHCSYTVLFLFHKCFL